MNRRIPFVLVFALVIGSTAKASTATEVELSGIAAKLTKLETLTAAGSCSNCSTSIAVLRHRIEELRELPGLTAKELDALSSLGEKLDALSDKLDTVPSLTAGEVVEQLAAKYGPEWEEAARKPSNTCATYVDALKSAGTDVQVLKALGDAVIECAREGAVAVDMAKVVCASGGVIKTNAVTIVCDAPAPPKLTPPVVPAAALVAPPSAPARTTLGWIASGVVGAAVGAGAGWYAGNSASPVVLTDGGINPGMGPPVSIIGALVGAAVGAGVYALATQQ